MGLGQVAFVVIVVEEEWEVLSSVSDVLIFNIFIRLHLALIFVRIIDRKPCCTFDFWGRIVVKARNSRGCLESNY